MNCCCGCDYCPSCGRPLPHRVRPPWYPWMQPAPWVRPIVPCVPVLPCVPHQPMPLIGGAATAVAHARQAIGAVA